MKEKLKALASKSLPILKPILTAGGIGAAAYFGGPPAAQLAYELFTSLFG